MPHAVNQLVKANHTSQVYLLHSDPWLLVGEVILSHPVKRLRSVLLLHRISVQFMHIMGQIYHILLRDYIEWSVL